MGGGNQTHQQKAKTYKIVNGMCPRKSNTKKRRQVRQHIYYPLSIYVNLQPHLLKQAHTI